MSGCQKPPSVLLYQKDRAYNCSPPHASHGFTLFSLPFSQCEALHWVSSPFTGCRSILLKPISFLFFGLCFWVRSPQDCPPSCRPLHSSQIELRPAKTGFHAENPSFLPLQPQWQLHPPRGKLINYGWMFDWQRLNDRSSVLTRLPHTENLVPIVLFKTCQTITEKLFFAQPVELALSPFF